MPVDLIVTPPPQIILRVTAVQRVTLVVSPGSGGGGGGGGTPDAHAPSHEDGGTDELDVTGLSGLLATAQTPATHASMHQNGGAGEINVAGLNGELADPQPPKTHASSHQNGNADEISVGGLSGTLADAQRANVIVEATPQDLTVGLIAVGEFAHRVGNTLVGGVPSNSLVTPSEFWAKPATAHALDVEFESSTLPAAFTLWNVNGATPSAVTPLSGIDIFTNPAAGTVRMEANKANRRSWCLMQPRGENVRWFYAQQVTLSGNNGWVFRSRFATHIKLLSGTNNAANMRLCICKDVAGKPDHISGNLQNGFAAGWESDGNTMAIEYAHVTGGAVTSVTTGADVDNMQAVDYETSLTLRAGAASVIWDMWFKAATVTQKVTTHTATVAAIGQGSVVWVGWEFLGVDADMPSAPILSADYMRVEDTVANFLP